MSNVIKQQETKFGKSAHGGHKAVTVVTVNGVCYNITTMKRYSKKLVSTYTQFKDLGNGAKEMTEFSFFAQKDPNMNGTLISEAVRVTQDAVKDQHYKALAAFEELAKTLENDELLKQAESAAQSQADDVKRDELRKEYAHLTEGDKKITEKNIRAGF